MLFGKKVKKKTRKKSKKRKGWCNKPCPLGKQKGAWKKKRKKSKNENKIFSIKVHLGGVMVSLALSLPPSEVGNVQEESSNS